MTQTISIAAEPRAALGKGPAGRLRREGKVPAVIYGHGRAPEPLSVSATDLEKVLQGISAESTLIELRVAGSPTQVLIREIQRHPTRRQIEHIDFYEVHAGEVLTVGVPVRLVGVPSGVRNGGGVLEQFLREIEIEVLPKDIPERIDVDVTSLEIGHSIHVRDLAVANAEILEEPDATLCTVVPPRVEEEPTVVALEEGVTEPELIRRAKPEGEEPEGEEAGEEDEE